MDDFKETNWKNAVSRSNLLVVKFGAIAADLGIIQSYLENGAVPNDDIEGLFAKTDELASFINELRVGIEISAEVHSVSDDDLDKLIDQDME